VGLTDYTIGDKRFFQSGVSYEQERILKLLDTSRMCKCSDICITDINIYAFVKEELGIDLFELIKPKDDDD
jgi:hypothetical protein